MLIEQIIIERYVNAVGFDDEAQATKQKYKKQVWDILQKSYAPIGGIKGNGFESPDAMVEKIPMWKIAIRDGRVRAVRMYKDKGGRKSVAIGTDGSPEGAWFVTDMVKNELGRSYSEQSKASLGKTMKTYPWEVLKNFLVSIDRVQSMTPDEKIIPIKSVNKNNWPTDAKMTLDRYPMLLDYGYLRDFNGEMIFKIMLGSPGKTIKRT